MTDKELVELAFKALETAYTPYSGYKVGTALLTKSGKVYLGCNIENASYSPTVCAERTAFFKAVSEGEKEFSMIAVVGGKNGNCETFFMPCGVCRQVMAEFCSSDFKVIIGKSNGEIKSFTLGEILPFSFGPIDITI
ncbi:MAG: cytidine deaminase [Clostridiales bacterium GWF2_36_10]|nr:MAG: cytidine deaminase [Clostridiales bacterium GWF2_36_10]